MVALVGGGWLTATRNRPTRGWADGQVPIMKNLSTNVGLSVASNPCSRTLETPTAYNLNGCVTCGTYGGTHRPTIFAEAEPSLARTNYSVNLVRKTKA